jgi:hypothetical protein
MQGDRVRIERAVEGSLGSEFGVIKAEIEGKRVGKGVLKRGRPKGLPNRFEMAS